MPIEVPKDRKLHVVVQTRIATDSWNDLRKYSETLERLLSEETARVHTRELLSDIEARARQDEFYDDEPSEELILLRNFPSTLRASLLPQVHGVFERRGRSIPNLALSPEKRIEVGANVNAISGAVNTAWPETFADHEVQQLADYMHLRHACAHAGGQLGRDLFDPKRVARAAQRTPGAKFVPLVKPGPADRSLVPNSQRWSGWVEFDASFLPAAIGFHETLLKRLSAVVRSSG